MNKLYLPLPEISFPVDELKEWSQRNQENFRNAGEFTNGLYGCFIPYRFSKILNDQIKLDLSVCNTHTPVFGRGQVYILKDTYEMHTDPRRDASLNFLLSGESVTMWEGGTVCPYKPDEAMLFNTQVPHAIFLKETDEPRMAVSFLVTMGFQRFVNLYNDGAMFDYHDRLMHWAEIIPS